MTSIAADTRAAVISLELGCHGSPLCDEFAGGLYAQLRHGYEICSAQDVPASAQEWAAQHRTARKRSARCRRLGYTGREIRRHEFTDDVYAINTSMRERQGRPMSRGYRARPSDAPLPEYPCDRHCVRTFGVTLNGTLYAYSWIYRAGDLVLVSSILGHGDHLQNDVMYELWSTIVSAYQGTGGSFVYNRADSGTEGLRYFKAKLGFQACRVEWLP